MQTPRGEVQFVLDKQATQYPDGPQYGVAPPHMPFPVQLATQAWVVVSHF
ncbi:MAG TPA: hypothetical protein VER11_03685 [Polyangiaceae bacterium]|nr:hypothetical protein [Polyangiaceae bacterium]